MSHYHSRKESEYTSSNIYICVYQMPDAVECVVNHWESQSKFAESKKLGPKRHGVNQIKVIWVTLR